jgi:uncharacterized membrane protein YbhN (UPF0104 family)
MLDVTSRPSDETDEDSGASELTPNPQGRGARRASLRSAAGWLVVGVIFYFIGRSLVNNWDELAEADLHFDVWLLLASFLILGVWMVLQAMIWHLLTVSNGAHIPLPRAMAAWFYSQLGKYVPGKVFLYLGRVHLYSREGRGAGPVTVAFGVEFVGSLAAAVVMVLVAALTSDVAALDEYHWALAIALVAFLVALHPRFIGWAVRLAARALGRQPFEVGLSYPRLLGFVALYFVNWTLFGLALFVFIRSFYALEFDSILYLAGAFSLSSIIGILAVFAPSGLGVREGVLALFLAPVMPNSIAVVVSVASRLWLTVAELAAAGIAYSMVRSAGTRDLPGTGTERTMPVDGGVEDGD